jgi:hypothetical protein
MTHVDGLPDSILLAGTTARIENIGVDSLPKRQLQLSVHLQKIAVL